MAQREFLLARYVFLDVQNLTMLIACRYGGNPLGSATAIAALDVLVDEKLCERAEYLGNIFREGLNTLRSVGADKFGSNGWIKEVRGLGMMNAIVIDSTKSSKGRGAWHLCLLMKEKGLLAKPTHVNTYAVLSCYSDRS